MVWQLACDVRDIVGETLRKALQLSSTLDSFGDSYTLAIRYECCKRGGQLACSYWLDGWLAVKV